MSQLKARKMPGKKTLIIIAAVVFIALLLIYRISGLSEGPASEEETVVNVKTAQVELASISATSPISGRVKPIEEATIIPMASGEITSVRVSLGDYVKKGAVLFEIDKTQLATTLNQTKEMYSSAKSTYDRMAVLYNEGAVSLQAYEQAQSQYISARENYNSASNAYSNCTVTSPINGYVTSLSASVGSLASPSMPAATIADVSALEINTSVSEYLISKIKVGDPVDIHIATLGEAPYKGTIKALSPAPASGGLTYPITVSVEDESGSVIAGMFAEIQIVSDEKDKVLCIPSDAVIIKAGKSIVVVLDGDMPRYAEVTTGIDNGEFVEITSGLSEGETIVTVGQQFVKEGVAVKITE